MKIDMKTLVMCRLKVAHLVLHDPVYVPIFERLEREIEALQKEQDAVGRARAIVEENKAAKEQGRDAKSDRD